MKIILHLSRFAWRLLFALLIATALALSVVRFWLLPGAAEWREALEISISKMVGQTVHIKTLSAGMRGFKPELMMRGLRIDNADGGSALEFLRLGVGLDLVNTFLTRQAVINRVELEGGRVRVFRNADGSFGVAGLQAGPSTQPPAWLLAQGEVRLSDIDLEWADTDAPPIALGRAQARLRNLGENHVLDVRVDLLGKLGKSLRLSADIDGNPTRPGGWNGRAYLEAKRLREGVFGESAKVRMRSGEAGFQAWAEWRDGVLGEVRGKLELDRPVFAWHGVGGPDGLLGLDKLTGGWRWQGTAKDWRLDVSHVSLSHGGKPWPVSDFAFAMREAPDGGLQNLRAAFGYLRLDDALTLLGGAPLLDEKTRETLRGLAPRGELRDTRLIYQAEGKLGFCGQLLGVSFKGAEQWPGFGRFNGRVCGNDRNGEVDLNIAKTDLNLPGVFPKPVAIDALKGKLAWRRLGGVFFPPDSAETAPAAPPDDFIGPLPEAAPSPARHWLAGSGWRIVGNQIQLAAPGVQALGGFGLDLPPEASASPVLDMKVQLHDVDAIHVKDYLPLGVMDPEIAGWHINAYHAGQFTDADVQLRGRLADLPFANGEGVFEAKVTAQNMELQFNPKWPRLFGINAKIALSGPTMTVESEGGRFGDVPLLKPVHAYSANYVGDGWLNLSSDFDTELGALLKFLQQTAVRSIPQRLAKAFDATGPAHLDMKVAIPLGVGDIGVVGLLQLQNAAMALKGLNLKVQDLTGTLDFTESNLGGKQITGIALGEPIVIDVDQQADEIQVDVLGKTSVDALRKVFPGELWRHAEGEFGYHLDLGIPKSLDPATDPLHFALVSDLTGLELKLPAPLAKAAATKKDLSANLTLRRGAHSSLNLSYGEGRARVKFNNGENISLESGDIFWGKPPVPPGDEPGLGLYLKLGTLDLDAWRKLLGEPGASSAPTLPHGLDVQVDNLIWNGEALGPLHVAGKRDHGEFFGGVDFKYIRGRFSALDGEGGAGAVPASVQLDLDSLNLPKFDDDKPGQTPTTPPDPATLPALQIHARQFIRQGAELGELELETERWPDGMSIKNFALHSDNHEFSVKGGWTRQEGRDETRLEGRLHVGDLGTFLPLLGFGQELLATPTESAFSLNWPGAPQQFSAATLGGEVRLKMGRGSVPQVDPGLGRALGFLNLPTLRRLLLLDFSDIFGKGLAYDSMAGVFNLQAGQARTKGFVIDAAAADILVIGRVGLGEHDFEQTVSVMPHALASIPLAVPMVGGAVVGGVIDLAHRLVGAEDVNLASSNYAITGTWDNPQIKRISGTTPLEMINRAWSGIKGMGGNGAVD